MTEHIRTTSKSQTNEISRPNWSAVFAVAFLRRLPDNR
ncbi:Uncharacterised protein [Raoultella terrigena]|uniref:Uncharacterized protein n=1 Tax=Raoultella terrigena TaxID=577 RepID=A0A485CU56_RAOTE|nr:Uncharacterised protein [Raoultella terrigena]